MGYSKSVTSAWDITIHAIQQDNKAWDTANLSPRHRFASIYPSGPGCSKLTTLLVSETLRFQRLIS